ncbi:aminotransferase class I/II-fold pyridoxal phosphate-dependent enzyme [Thiohalobacter thiocyanaticus]|uniref:aminotransferase class I/II-fold pyridoxal phosphate-dependent enzyme n=1 Tax=Thiohalobacter thiocyanaticus TaxID=585455 RepID=UPI0021019C4D|nr:aminotransferase class I/II-fold pyridoxal phosphate-dependent enzyme [Thiohalobacter thiocyanaticus]
MRSWSPAAASRASSTWSRPCSTPATRSSSPRPTGSPTRTSVLLADGNPVIVDARIEQGFKVLPEQLEAAITPRTRLVVINSPSNPTGMAYDRAELEALGEVLRRHPQVLIATDDMYEHIRWADEPFVNIINACPDLYERTSVLNGRLQGHYSHGPAGASGDAGGPAAAGSSDEGSSPQSTSNPAAVSQADRRRGLNGDQSSRINAKGLRERHDYLGSPPWIMPGVHACTPATSTSSPSPTAGR